MSIDSISLVAQNAYTKVNNQQLADVKEAANFQDMVKVSFNRFASMSPDQILSHINSAKAEGVNAVASANNGLAESAFGELRKKLSNNEETIGKSLIGDASLLDVVNTTNDAKNTLQVMVTVRDKMLEAFEKIMAMQI